jgi:hypothetical protein
MDHQPAMFIWRSWSAPFRRRLSSVLSTEWFFQGLRVIHIRAGALEALDDVDRNR